MRTKKKKSAATAYKSVTQADISRAVARGADVRRVWELQNVQTKKLAHLTPLSAPDVLKGSHTHKKGHFFFSFFIFFFSKEIRSHRNRHEKAALSWLHLYLSKVDSKEEADTEAQKAIMEYQASGFKLNAMTAGLLVGLTVRTKSDLALLVLASPSKYLLWPEKRTVARLLCHYGSQGDVEAARVVWRVVLEKGFTHDALMHQYLFRAYANANDLAPLDMGRNLWPLALNALKSGLVDTFGYNLLVKVAARDPVAPREVLLNQSIKSNASTEKLKKQLMESAPVVAAAATAAAAPTGSANAAQSKN